MKQKSLEIFIPSSSGRIEGRYFKNQKKGSPIAIMLHPHPQYGGTMNNRIVQETYSIFIKNGFSVLKFNFRGVIYDVDFEFNNSEEWYKSIPKDVRPRKDQPFYHLLAESNEITYEAYVSEQNLVNDDCDEPIKHPLIEEIFSGKKGSGYFRPSN